MIVDESDSDIEMVQDPFLEAGIDIPEELPYQESRKSTIISRFSKKHQSDRLNGTDLSSMIPINGEDLRIWVLGFRSRNFQKINLLHLKVFFIYI